MSAFFNSSAVPGISMLTASSDWNARVSGAGMNVSSHAAKSRGCITSPMIAASTRHGEKKSEPETSTFGAQP